MITGEMRGLRYVLRSATGGVPAAQNTNAQSNGGGPNLNNASLAARPLRRSVITTLFGSVVGPFVALPARSGVFEIGIQEMHDLSLVLLPLRNSVMDSRRPYISEALTDYLTGDLSRLRGSIVIARASASAAAAAASDEKQIAERLVVRFVLSGTVTVEQDNIRLTAHLLDAANGHTLWRTEFTGSLAELAKLRSGVTSHVAQSISADIPTSLAGADIHPAPADLVDLLLRAKALLLESQTAATLSEARRLLDTAMAHDPRSVEAMTELAAVHLAEALRGSAMPLQDVARAEELIGEALTIDPGNAQALALRGAMLRLRRKSNEALTAYEAAVASNPSFADAHAEIGRLKIDVGEAGDAVASVEKALRLSPLDPQRPLWLSFAGMASLYAGRPAEAVPWLERAAAANPRFVNPIVWLAAAYQLTGRDAQAASSISRLRELSPGMSVGRLERQLASSNARVNEQLAAILGALKRAGLSE